MKTLNQLTFLPPIPLNTQEERDALERKFQKQSPVETAWFNRKPRAVTEHTVPPRHLRSVS